MKKIIFILLLFSTVEALACSCDRNATDQSRFDAAHSVVLAEITDTRLIKSTFESHEIEYIEAKIDVIETIKLGDEEIGAVHGLSFGFGNCSVGLMSGLEYIFYIRKNDEKDEFNNFVNTCDGSIAVNIHKNDFDEDLQKIRDLASSEKP